LRIIYAYAQNARTIFGGPGDVIVTADFDGIEQELGEDIGRAIIWLHGLGADASDFLPIIGELGLPSGVRFVFPNAPYRPVTINGGMVMRAWYDILGFGPGSAEDSAGIAASAALVRRLVEREGGRGIPAERIVLAGFSQGGAIALHAGLAGCGRLAGILGLSTYLPAAGLLDTAGRISTDIPVRMMHGTDDPVIPLALARASAATLEARGIAIEWSTYRMAHEVSWAEIRDISAWLQRL
jgi:phospholipase/carboxylesterase